MNFKCGGPYFGFPDWTKNKKATVNPKKKDDKCFRYAATVALNYRQTKWNLERVSNIEPFINKYDRDGIKYSSKMEDWKKFEINNLKLRLMCYMEKK